MTALEMRLLAYIGAGLAYTALIIWATVTLTNHHWERITAADKLAQASAFQAQQQKTIDDLKAQQVATQAAEKQYADLKASSDGLSTRLADSVRSYAELRRGLVSATSTAAALADATRQGTERDSTLASLVRSATEACQGDAAQLTALQTWAHSFEVQP